MAGHEKGSCPRFGLAIGWPGSTSCPSSAIESPRSLSVGVKAGLGTPVSVAGSCGRIVPEDVEDVAMDRLAVAPAGGGVRADVPWK